MSLRIFIVEDEPVTMLDLRVILEDAGHQVVGSAYSMKDALRVFGHLGSVDAVIMDVELAEGHVGVELARRLRDEQGVPSLFVSARLDYLTRAVALELNPIGFVDKPFHAWQIIRALKSVGEAATKASPS